VSTYLITGASILDGEPTDVLIRDGVVARVSTSSTTGGATDEATDEAATGSTTEVVDGTGMVLLPGLVDLHTHLREPGREDAETVETGTMAAAMGGFTAVHAMANTEPVADTAGVVEQVTNGVAVRMAVLYLLLGGSEPIETPAERAPQGPPAVGGEE